MKKNIYYFLLVMMMAVVSVGFVSCGGDDDDDDSSSSGAKVLLKLSANSITSYTATITVTGASASDVTVLGVRAEPSSTSGGYKPSKIVEAGSHSTTAKCNITLERGTTYYIYAYANINGQRITSSKQTVMVRK